MSISVRRGVRAHAIAAAVCVGTIVVNGCASYPKTPRLSAYDLAKGYRFTQVPTTAPARPNSDELFVVLSFSGGGTRAAALAYGVLAQLRAVRLGDRTLLDEVDVISSVSGGSFTSAYYALHGDGLFDPQGAFHRSFLYYPVQRDLMSAAVYRPANWARLRSRVEIAATLYASRIFGGATFQDLQARTRPFVILNATDAATGARFEFTQEQFDLLCADLSAFPIARAVAASSAFPGLLNAMTIDSYNAAVDGAPGGCGYTGPGTGTHPADWVSLAMKDAFVSYPRYNAARQLQAYRDPSRTHLHLLDGGLADNIGLRSVLQSLGSGDIPVVGTTTGGWSLLRMIENDRIKTVVVITVNARTNRKKDWDTKSAGPGTFSVLSASSGIPMGNFSTETLELLRRYGFDAGLNEAGGPAFFGVEVAFENLTDPLEQAFLSGMGTNFELAPFEVNCLIDRGAQLLRESRSVTDGRATEFAAFVRDRLNGTVVPADVTAVPACTDAAGRREIATRNHYLDIGLQYAITRADSPDVKDKHGAGLAVRVTKPNGWGVTVGFGTERFDVPAVVGGTALTLGEVQLRTISGGAFLAQRWRGLEASAGVSVGYGFGGFDLTNDARDAYARQQVIGLDPTATNSWVVRPNASVWHNVTDRLAATVSVSYAWARPTVRFGGVLPDRRLDVKAVTFAAGIGVKVF